MAQPVTDLAGQFPWTRHRRAEVCVRVWRDRGSIPQELFTFAGAVEAVALGAVLHHVHFLTCELPGYWRIDVIAAGLDRSLLRAIRAALRQLQRNGQRVELSLAPRSRPTRPPWSARTTLALLAPTLPH